jgi:regulator of nonsense transcripts 2
VIFLKANSCSDGADSITSLSELLYLQLPPLPTDSQKSDSILIGANNVNHWGEDSDDILLTSGGKWEDEEERKFFEDIQDLKDFVPKSVLGVESDETEGDAKTLEREKLERENAANDAKKLEEELEVLKIHSENQGDEDAEETAENIDKDSPVEEEDE